MSAGRQASRLYIDEHFYDEITALLSVHAVLPELYAALRENINIALKGGIHTETEFRELYAKNILEITLSKVKEAHAEKNFLNSQKKGEVYNAVIDLYLYLSLFQIAEDNITDENKRLEYYYTNIDIFNNTFKKLMQSNHDNLLPTLNAASDLMKDIANEVIAVKNYFLKINKMIQNRNAILEKLACAIKNFITVIAENANKDINQKLRFFIWSKKSLEYTSDDKIVSSMKSIIEKIAEWIERSKNEYYSDVNVIKNNVDPKEIYVNHSVKSTPLQRLPRENSSSWKYMKWGLISLVLGALIGTAIVFSGGSAAILLVAPMIAKVGGGAMVTEILSFAAITAAASFAVGALYYAFERVMKKIKNSPVSCEKVKPDKDANLAIVSRATDVRLMQVLGQSTQKHPLPESIHSDQGPNNRDGFFDQKNHSHDFPVTDNQRKDSVQNVSIKRL